MRSALLCVFFTFFVQRGGSQTAKDDDFRPTPIPLDEWHPASRGNLAGTLHETIDSDPSAVGATVPAHYWEDALRHSVYLTLVRDKIDQLISKGAVASSDHKPDRHISEEDDRDLWQKVKTAPFDRLKDEVPAEFGDVTIMAKGRLLEEKGGFHFTEDEASKEKCNNDKCMEGVKAIWSVKRVRQRDVETPGKYHYELTFSVTSKSLPKKQRKSFETPIRTFTVRENSSAEQHLEARINELKQMRLQRPQRAIWFHKNIVPTQHYQGRNYNQGLDRIFSSLFTNEDSFDDAPRYKQNTYVPQVFPQYSKIGHVGSSSEQYHQKKLMPYAYKPQSYKYSRPPLHAPPIVHAQHHYLDFDPMTNNHYTPTYMDQRYVSSSPVKTTRPAVLPTPPASVAQSKNVTDEETISGNRSNITDNTTKKPDILTPPTHITYNKPKLTPMKISYFPDHVRPPVFNAPPGVFVTMDKKPFKPMPPLKLVHTSKPMRNKPTDFRPSPQVLDIQFSDPDPLHDSAFRPITVKYTDNNITESNVPEHNKNKISRKKPTKKHENVKSHRVTTTTFTPDIITAGSDSIEDNDTMQWANVLGAFTRTTPMASQRERANATESFVSVTSETVPITTIASSTTTTASTTKAAEVTTTKSTTSRPKKRTRPPHKFTKPEKIKKHKRITSTTTTTKVPEVIQTKKPQQDLTPQATSAITGGLKNKWEPKNKTASTTPLTTSTTHSTTSRPSTTTTVITTTTKDEEPYKATTQPKSKNRFRQSTLMQKGTSVKHDKWSTPNFEKIATKLVISPSGKVSTRRKGSNFHGYLPSSTPKYIDQQRNKEDHEDHVSSAYVINISSTTENIFDNISEKSSPPKSYDDSLEHSEIESDIEQDLIHNHEELDEDFDENIEKNDDLDNHEESNEEDSRDHSEYIFQNTSTTPSEKTNEIIEEEKISPTVATVLTSPHPVFRNKTKCKKKKHHNLTTTEETPKENNDFENEIVTKLTTTSTTESAATPDIFQELFAGFTMDETSEKPKESQPTIKSEPDEGGSENHERYVHIDDDFEDFLDSLEKKENHSDVKNKDEEQYDDDKDFSADEEDSPFNYEDENEAARNSKDDTYDEYHDRPYSLLELMAME